MNRIMVFGKPSGGKSTLAKRLSSDTGLPLFPLDLMEYNATGERLPADRFLSAHSELISQEKWVIEGLGTLPSFWARIDAADTLVYVDLPYRVHYWWATKRLLKSVAVKPEGWPEGSSVLKGTMASWKYLKLSRQYWTPELLGTIRERAGDRTFYHISTVKALNRFRLNTGYTPTFN